MAFNEKSIAEISDIEVADVVANHTQERQHLEFKVTYDTKDDDSKFEVLKDIVSFANASGGYIIIGIRDDGTGRAQKFESLDAKIAERVKQSISHLCIEHIEERIEGLELEVRTIEGNTILLIRVPASARAPHMITFQYQTHFTKRYQDGKREMSLAEIRNAFNEDFASLRLSAMENLIRGLQAPQIATIRDRADLLRLTEGEVLAHHARVEFEKAAGDKSKFYIAVTPCHPKQIDIETASAEVVSIVNKPPGSRPRGWSMANLSNERRQRGRELVIGSAEHNLLALMPNGHMEFQSLLDESFCWKQSESEFKLRPRLYAYAMVEYPVSFLRLYKALLETTDITDDAYVLTIEFHNVRGFILGPHHPNSPLFDHPGRYSKPYPETSLVISRTISAPIDPEIASYAVLKDIYASFGFDENAIPFFDDQTQAFNF